MTEKSNEVVLSNGAVADSKTGMIVRGAPLTTSQARALANTRWKKAQAAAVKGLRELSTCESALEAWKQLVQKQYLLATNIEAGRSSTEAARFVGQATGFLSQRGDSTGDNANNPLQELGAIVAKRILGMIPGD